MITTIIIVDSFIEDGLYNTLNVLKNDSCTLLKIDLYSTTQEKLCQIIQEFITSQLESSTLNLSKILFVNFDVVSINIESNNFIGKSGKLFDLEYHDPNLKSWFFVHEIISTLRKMFELELVDFFDINHLLHYNSYILPLSYVEEMTTTTSFNISVRYLSKFCSLNESETLKTSTNWLHSLFTTHYTENAELKNFIDVYFKVNNTNISFLENLSLNILDLFSTTFVELPNNSVVNNTDTTIANIMLFPIHNYKDKLKLMTLVDYISRNKCYVCFIYEQDEIENITETIENIIKKVYNENSSSKIELNLCIHIDSDNILDSKFSLNNAIQTIDVRDHSSGESLLPILEMLQDNPKINFANVNITNIYDLEKEFTLDFAESLVNKLSKNNVKFIFENTVNDYNGLVYKPNKFLDFSTFSYQVLLERECKSNKLDTPFLLKFLQKEENCYEFIHRIKTKHLILYDASLSQYLPDVFDSKTVDTEILIYESTETFSTLKDKISEIKNNHGVLLDNVALFKKNIPSFHFSLFEEEKSLKYNVIEDSSDWSYADNVDLSDDLLSTDASLAEVNMEEIKSLYYSSYNGPDPSLNTWQHFSDFLLFLQNDVGVSNFDILTCKLVGPDWEYILSLLQKRLSTLTIHSSIDTTGHVMFEGNWILETPNNVNVVGLYFNDSIYNVEVNLDAQNFTSISVLVAAIRDIIKISTHDTTVATYGPISDWGIGIKTFKYGNGGLFSLSSFGYTVPTDWSKLDGMNNWDVSQMTSLENAFRFPNYNPYYHHSIKFNSPIGSWDVGNVTNMNAAFYKAWQFDQDIGSWNVSNVTSMHAAFAYSTRINQNLGNWNVSKVRNMSSMFFFAHMFNGDIENWDVTNVTDMNAMFYSAPSFNKDISNWEISNVTNFSQMFRLASGFTIALNGKWKLLPCQTLAIGTPPYVQYMFSQHHENLNIIPSGHINVDYDPAVGFTSLEDLKKAYYIHCVNSLYAESLFGRSEDWNVSSITNLDGLMESYPRYHTAFLMDNWDVGNVTSMERTFKNLIYFDSDISNWNVSKVTSMKEMFYGTSTFNRDLSSWDVANVTDMTSMFMNSPKFKWDISNWNTANANTTNMFQGATDYNNQILNSGFVADYTAVGHVFTDLASLKSALNSWKSSRTNAQTSYGHISKWNVSAVTDFSNLFSNYYGGIAFSEDLNSWDTGNVTNMYRAFKDARNCAPKISSWNTSNVTNMSEMFYNSYHFNGNIENWDVSKVTNMSRMFQGAYKFDGNIVNWDVGNVNNMLAMCHTTLSFNRDLSNWNVDNVTNFTQMWGNAVGINQVFTGSSWISVSDRYEWPFDSIGDSRIHNERLGIGFKNGGTNSIQVLRKACQLYAQHRKAALLKYPEISQWDVSQMTNFDDLFNQTNITSENIGTWNVSNVTSMAYTFAYCDELNSDLSNWNTGKLQNATQTFLSCKYSSITGVENWNTTNVTNMNGMFSMCHAFNRDLSNWDVKNTTSINGMFSDCWALNKDVSRWKLESIDKWGWVNGAEGLKGIHRAFYKTYSYNVVLDQTWTVLHEQINSYYTNTSQHKTFDQYITHLFDNTSPGTVSDIPYNAPKITFTSTVVSNNDTYENNEIDMEIVLTQAVSGNAQAAITATNGTIKNFYQESDLLYKFVFTATTFGQPSQFNVGTNSDNIFAEYIVETFEWTWSPPVTVMTLNSSDISNNQTQLTSSINMEINLSREFLTNTQLIQKEDISVTNGVVTGFQRIVDTQYTFTFIATAPNVDSVIQMETSFDPSNTTLPNPFTWTWTANIEQPVLTLTSVDVANNGTIKKNEIDMVLTYTSNSKLAFSSLTEGDISFTNGFIVNDSFSKNSPTQYSFKFRSLSRDTDSTIYIPQDQFQYNFVDGATNLTESYEGSNTFTWRYNGLDIELINNKTVAVITSDQKESKSLDLILHGNVTYDPIYNEYNFEKSTSDYMTISGEILNGLGEASISFWYKTKTTANTSFATLLTLRNDDNDNFTLQRYATQDKLNIKSSGSGTINTTTTNLPYYNTNYVHMVVTFTETEILVYKNSVLEETHSVSNVIAGGERVFQIIGASVSSANVIYRYFNGYIKNLRFYNYAIPSTEVSALYTMYNTGMNDTAPQILSVSLATTDTLVNNEFTKAVINMEMDVTYDTVASISSIDTQSFIIDKSNFDTSFGYVFDFRQLSDTKVAFKFGASTTINNSQLFLKQDTITRNINSSLNVVSNPESNVFTWKYKSEPLTIQSIKSNIGESGSLTNQNVIWIQVIFSEEVFNFRKKYITGTNCKIIKTTGSGTTYAIKVQTFRPTSATIVIDIPTTQPITTGKGLNKALADANNTTYSWQYDNVVPTFTIETSQESGLTNNVDYVDVSVVISKPTSDFDINSLDINGSAEIVNFSGSGQNYSYRLQPFASSVISLTVPTNAFTDEYGNKNTSSQTFDWTYHNVKPEVYIASQDINSGDSADVGSIETYFVFSKPVSGFSLADVDITNGNLSELSETTTFPEHETTYNVTIGSKASADNPYASQGSSNAFFLNGEEAKIVSFVVGNTYTFNNTSNSTHPLKFYTDAEKTTGSEYTTGVTVSATSTEIIVDSSTPTTLYYQCEAHEYMGNMITYGQSYKATLIPATSSVSISLQITANKVKDELNIFNDTASNSFVWNYTGTEYMVSIESADIKSGASHLYGYVQISLSLTYATFDTVDASIFTIVNGTITNIVETGSGTYTFTLESVSPETETSIFLPENSVTRYDNNSEYNKESNKFVWTYTPPIPELTITSSDVIEGAFTNNGSIDLQLNFTENVIFDVNTINISNASGTLSGANNSYVLTVVPDVVADSSADILVDFPENTGFYNLFDSENLYNDVSYTYSWKYDSVIPTGTITSTIGTITQDICTNIQEVPFTIQFNKNMPSLDVNDFTITANGALSGLSGSGSIYSFVISALDNTIDNTISFKLGDDAITDEAGNSFISSNEFSFTITAKVSKVLETAAIAELFTDDADISEEDKLSSEEIDMVLAVEIPDLTVPDFDEPEEGSEITADVSYTVTVDTKTSSNSYYNQGSSSAYFIDGTEAPSLAVDQDNVYRFNQDDATNSGHPLLFYEDVDKSIQYTTDVSINGTPGTAGAYTQISITSDTPTTLYYQCGNHEHMGGTITIGEVDNIPVVALPAAVTITNSKVFTRLIDQILEKAEDVTAIKMSVDDVALSDTATEKIPDVEQVVMAKSNQIEPPVVIENTDTDSVLFVPLANEGDLVRVEINGVFYLTVVNADNTFSLTIDGVEATGSPFSKDDVYEIDETNSIIFGSQIISSSPPPPSPPTVDITSSVVQNGGTTTTGSIDLDLSFSTTIEIDLTNIYPLTSGTQITGSSIQSVDSSNSIVVVSVSPILPDVSAELGIVIYETTFYSTSNNIDYYNDISFSFSWNYDSTAYNNANVVEVIEEYEPLFINPNTGIIPCFMKDTNILTTRGYKKVQNIIPGKDKLIDHKNNVIECLEVKKYVKQNDGKEYPHKIPRGSQLSSEFTCNQDLFLTYNHCVYLPGNNMFAPVSLMKNIKPHVTNDPHFVYYHVFTSNYFSDTIIANGIPCESHSKYTFKYLREIDNSGKLLKKMMEKTNMLVNCQRNRISRKDYRKLIQKSKKQIKNKNKSRK